MIVNSSLPPTAASDRKAKTPDHPVSFFVRAPQRMIVNNFTIYANIPAILGIFFDFLDILHVYM